MIFSTIILNANYQKQDGEQHAPTLQKTHSEAMRTVGQSFAGL